MVLCLLWVCVCLLWFRVCVFTSSQRVPVFSLWCVDVPTPPHSPPTPPLWWLSGESGAGKTESCKLIVRHIVHLSKSKEDNIDEKIVMVCLCWGILGFVRCIVPYPLFESVSLLCVTLFGYRCFSVYDVLCLIPSLWCVRRCSVTVVLMCVMHCGSFRLFDVCSTLRFSLRLLMSAMFWFLFVSFRSVLLSSHFSPHSLRIVQCCPISCCCPLSWLSDGGSFDGSVFHCALLFPHPHVLCRCVCVNECVSVCSLNGSHKCSYSLLMSPFLSFWCDVVCVCVGVSSVYDSPISCLLLSVSFSLFWFDLVLCVCVLVCPHSVFCVCCYSFLSLVSFDVMWCDVVCVCVSTPWFPHFVFVVIRFFVCFHVMLCVCWYALTPLRDSPILLLWFDLMWCDVDVDVDVVCVLICPHSTPWFPHFVFVVI